VAYFVFREESVDMIENIEALVTQYERGDLTRRELLQALAVNAVRVTTLYFGRQTPMVAMRTDKNIPVGSWNTLFVIMALAPCM
jgi:hypothetical protein